MSSFGALAAFIDFVCPLCENPPKTPYLRGQNGHSTSELTTPFRRAFGMPLSMTLSHITAISLPPFAGATVLLIGALVLAFLAGITDFRHRRIPNWLTVPAFAAGVAANSFYGGWAGLRLSLLGTLVGLGVLLPFVLLRSLGAGDWKLAGALGAFTGPGLLIDLLLLSIFVAGVMAVILIIYKGRVRQTLRNIGHILVSLVTFQLPGHRVSLDNPESLKVPYGVALALSVMLYGAAQIPGAVR